MSEMPNVKIQRLGPEMPYKRNWLLPAADLAVKELPVRSVSLLWQVRRSGDHALYQLRTRASTPVGNTKPSQILLGKPS